MKIADTGISRHSLEAETNSAIEDEARAAADAVRAKRRTEVLLAMLASTPKASTAIGDLDESAAAKTVGATKTTFKRAGIEPDYFVGTRPRWRDAESVRAKFAARGKSPTTPDPRPTVKVDDVDVSAALASGGLRVVAGRGR